MAQFGSAQREPSMEEILASIRRIIEDSDAGRKQEEDAARAATETPVPAAPTRPEMAAQVIEVEAFRGEARARANVADAEAPRPSAESAVPSAAVVERQSSEVPEPTSNDDAGSDASVADDAEPPVMARASFPPDAWRLGVVAPEQPADEPDTFDQEIVSAVMQDASEVAAPADGDAPATQNSDSRASLISEAAGRQVAAAFGELNEALAARSRRNLDEMAEAMLRPMLQDWLDNNLPMLVEKLVREEIERVARGT
jgi:cell pole-organizing protein PopZ